METLTSDIPAQGDDRSPPSLGSRIQDSLATLFLYALYAWPLAIFGVATGGSFRLYLNIESYWTVLTVAYLLVMLVFTWGFGFPPKVERRGALIRSALLVGWIPLSVYHYNTLSRHLEQLDSMIDCGAAGCVSDDVKKPGEFFLTGRGNLRLKLTNESVAIDDPTLTLRQRALLMAGAQRWVDAQLAAKRADGALTPEEKRDRDIARYVD